MFLFFSICCCLFEVKNAWKRMNKWRFSEILNNLLVVCELQSTEDLCLLYFCLLHVNMVLHFLSNCSFPLPGLNVPTYNSHIHFRIIENCESQSLCTMPMQLKKNKDLQNISKNSVFAPLMQLKYFRWCLSYSVLACSRLLILKRCL